MATITNLDNLVEQVLSTHPELKGATGAKGDKGDKGEQGIQGEKGDTGEYITSVTRISGNGAGGTTDRYAIEMTGGTIYHFDVYNGVDGDGVTSPEIKTLYENNPNTNAFTDELLEKINRITSTQAINLDDVKSDLPIIKNDIDNIEAKTDNITVTTPINLDDVQEDIVELEERFTDMNEPNGFNRQDLSTVGIIELCTDGTTVMQISNLGVFSKRTDGTFATGTSYETVASARQIAIYPVAGQPNFKVWKSGKKYEYDDIQVAVFDTNSGLHFAYFDETGFKVSNNFDPAYFEYMPIVSVVYGNANVGDKVVFSDERHCITMDGTTHKYLHFIEGTRYLSGFGINGLTAGGTTYTSISAGIAYDEDIEMNRSIQTNTPFWYIDGTVWRGDNDGMSLGLVGTTNVQYNSESGGVWSLTELSNNQYMIVHFMLSNDAEFPVAKILGQNVYANRADARAGIETEISSLVVEGLPSPEMLFIGSVIINADGELELLDDGSTYLDLREAKITAQGGVSGLTTDSNNVLYDNTVDGTTFTNVKEGLDFAIDAITNIEEW